jgi:hypothetical protein
MFVVYCVNSGRPKGMYERESSAKARVTRNNKEMVMWLLTKRQDREYFSWDRREEWAYCTYADFETHFYRWLKDQ